jgi:hypothetical protein
MSLFTLDFDHRATWGKTLDGSCTWNWRGDRNLWVRNVRKSPPKKKAQSQTQSRQNPSAIILDETANLQAFRIAWDYKLGNRSAPRMDSLITQI